MAEERNLGELTLVTDDAETVVTVSWLGKSTASAPGELIGPVLLEAADRAQAGHKRLVFAFERLEFFNSATITVLLRTVRALRGRRVTLTIRYDDGKRWQRTFFDAFSGASLDESDDVRIEAVRA
jgi:hypothetical protein